MNDDDSYDKKKLINKKTRFLLHHHHLLRGHMIDHFSECFVKRFQVCVSQHHSPDGVGFGARVPGRTPARCRFVPVHTHTPILAEMAHCDVKWVGWKVGWLEEGRELMILFGKDGKWLTVTIELYPLGWLVGLYWVISLWSV